MDLYNKRFELFFATLLLVIFDSLFIYDFMFEESFRSVFYILNVLAGLLLSVKHDSYFRFLFLLLLVSVSLEFFGYFFLQHELIEQVELLSYLMFYSAISFLIIAQQWHASEINSSVIFGLMAGYMSLGMLAFNIFLTIEYFYPGSLYGLPDLVDATQPRDEVIMYFSFITLLTVGYGEILPLTPLTQKTAMLIGLMGQFYLVILTAVIVGKYLQQEKSR